MGRIAPLQQNAEIEPGGVRSDAGDFHSQSSLYGAYCCALSPTQERASSDFQQTRLGEGESLAPSPNPFVEPRSGPLPQWGEGTAMSAEFAELFILARRQHAAVAGKWRPGAKHLEGIADDGGLIAEHRLAELGLEPHRHRLGDPGAAADIDGVAVGMVEKGTPAELVSKP